jgi:MoaA/NifB/PqqE/SkfB family radical SAM enzyme
VEIELTNRCNLACIQCLRSQGLKPYQLGDISFENYQRMLAQFPEVVSICLNGFGEPLMHPLFLKIVSYTRATLPGSKITIYSNGMLLTEALAHSLPRSGLTEINVSIDAATPETYRKVRRGGELEVVHENLRTLLRARRASGTTLPQVGVNFVLLNENEGELVRFVEQAAELGVDFVNCITYATYDWGFVNRRTPESYRKELKAAQQRLAELKLVCRSFPSDDLSWADPQRPFGCDFFWGGSVRVTYEGHVTLGCCTPFKETYSYGNILETPFSELWNGQGFRENRALARGRIPPQRSCAECAEQTRGFFAPRAPELVQLHGRKAAKVT